jgi:hypothetical protein
VNDGWFDGGAAAMVGISRQRLEGCDGDCDFFLPFSSCQRIKGED